MKAEEVLKDLGVIIESKEFTAPRLRD